MFCLFVFVFNFKSIVAFIEKNRASLHFNNNKDRNEGPRRNRGEWQKSSTIASPRSQEERVVCGIMLFGFCFLSQKGKHILLRQPIKPIRFF